MTRVVERRLEFDTAVERVWRAISDPAEIAQWFGDGAELDLRPEETARSVGTSMAGTQCGSR